MKKFLDNLLDLTPNFIFAVLLVAILMFMVNHDLSYEHMIKLIEVLVWPAIAFSALFFFRKVFTYLFLSMDEFNFFGNKGKLKNVTEVIDERVQLRIAEEARKDADKQEREKLEKQLSKARSTKENSNKKAEDNLKLAQEIYTRYKEKTEENEKILKELELLRQEKIDRERRRAQMMERVQQMRNERMHRIRSQESGTSGDTNSSISKPEQDNSSSPKP